MAVTGLDGSHCPLIFSGEQSRTKQRLPWLVVFSGCVYGGAINLLVHLFLVYLWDALFHSMRRCAVEATFLGHPLQFCRQSLNIRELPFNRCLALNSPFLPIERVSCCSVICVMTHLHPFHIVLTAESVHLMMMMMVQMLLYGPYCNFWVGGNAGG